MLIHVTENFLFYAVDFQSLTSLLVTSCMKTRIRICCATYDINKLCQQEGLAPTTMSGNFLAAVSN